jgi:hypothetical protein
MNTRQCRHIKRPGLVSDIARLLGTTSDGVRYLIRTGKLAALQTPSGVNVVDIPDAEALRDQRHAQRDLRHPARPAA